MRILCCSLLAAVLSFGASFDYKLIATTKTSTLEKEMNEAAAQGFAYSQAMGGETAFGGKEGVVIMMKDPAAASKLTYKVLATNKTSTMEKEMTTLGNEGFEYKGQTVFNTAFGGQEVVVIMERNNAKPARKITYKLLATSKTSTMEKELKESGADGFLLVGTTVAKTSFGGAEVVSIMRHD